MSTYILANKQVIEFSKRVNIGHKSDTYGVRDMSILLEINSNLFKLQGSIYEKAAYVLQQICKKHPFESANRRTAYILAITILFSNLSQEEFDFQKKLTQFFKPESPKIMTKIRTTDDYSIEDIVKWLKK